MKTEWKLVPVEPTNEMVEALKARITTTSRGGLLGAGAALAEAIAAAPVPPTSGDVEVLTVAWLELNKMPRAGMAYATAFKVNHRQTELVDRAHVTRLEDALDACDGDRHRLRDERDALQSELTKARELLSDAVDDAKRYLASDAGWARYGNRRDHIEAEYDAMLAHQSAPAAKCERCESSTVESCDDKGCGFLVSGNGEPAAKGVE